MEGLEDMPVFRRTWMIWMTLLALLLTQAIAEPADATPEAAPTAEAPADGETAQPRPAKGYVLVSTATQSGWLPLPEEGETSFPLSQVLPDGTQTLNVIHLTPDGVYMEDSTCKNHDCMDQGTVTLENRDERILGNMIICLPNQVCLQLFTPEETLEMMRGIQRQE